MVVASSSSFSRPAARAPRLGELVRRLISFEKVFVRKDLKILTFFLQFVSRYPF